MKTHITNVQHGGKLPDEIPQPEFLTDPSHRVKVMVKPIFKMASNVKDPDRCNKINPLRLRKYTGCYIAQHRHLPLDGFLRNAKAPVEHLFNDHQWCGTSW